jgi:hypothetical protein
MQRVTIDICSIATYHVALGIDMDISIKEYSKDLGRPSAKITLSKHN